MTGRELRAQLRAQLPRNSGATQTVANRPDELHCRRWRIHFPNLAPVEVWFTPEVTAAHALASCFGAIEAAPLPDVASRTATEGEANELRALVGALLADVSNADRAEALAVALADVDAALMSFRALPAGRNGQGMS
jgi:hypothetical protein